MLETIAKLGILLGTPTIYASLILLGFIFLKEAMFGRTLLILLFTMIYNVWLKSIWQVPLPQPLEGWAFPSGHMIAALAAWGWLAVEARQFWFSSLVFLGLCFIAYGILYFVYHTPIDIIGAVGFGSLGLLAYWLIGKIPYFSQKPYRLGFLLAILSIAVFCLTPWTAQKPHMWQAFGILVGFTIGWYQLSRNGSVSLSLTQKLLVICILGAGALGWTRLLSQLPLATYPSMFVQYIAVGWWICMSKLIASKLPLRLWLLDDPFRRKYKNPVS